MFYPSDDTQIRSFLVLEGLLMLARIQCNNSLDHCFRPHDQENFLPRGIGFGYQGSSINLSISTPPFTARLLVMPGIFLFEVQFIHPKNSL